MVVLHKGVVFFGRSFGKGLEPVGDVGHAVLHRPGLHTGGNFVGNGQVQGTALVDALHQLVEGIDVQVFPHVAAVENEGAEILGGSLFRSLDRGGFLLESILYHIKS